MVTFFLGDAFGMRAFSGVKRLVFFKRLTGPSFFRTSQEVYAWEVGNLGKQRKLDSRIWWVSWVFRLGWLEIGVQLIYIYIYMCIHIYTYRYQFYDGKWKWSMLKPGCFKWSTWSNQLQDQESILISLLQLQQRPVPHWCRDVVEHCRSGRRWEETDWFLGTSYLYIEFDMI